MCVVTDCLKELLWVVRVYKRRFRCLRWWGKTISFEARQWNSNVLKQDVGFKGRRNRESHILVEIRNRNYKSFRQRLQFAIFKYIEIFSDIGKKFLLSIINSLNILFIDNEFLISKLNLMISENLFLIWKDMKYKKKQFLIWEKN